MTPFQSKLPGPRCMCPKHYGLCFGVTYPAKNPGLKIVTWNGKTIAKFRFHTREVEHAYNAFIKDKLARQETCIMTVKERRRGNFSHHQY